jgi:hypothetical protein
MGSGTQWVTGSFVATGAALNIDTVGFSPRIVELRKTSGTIGSMSWDDSMPDASGYKQVGGTSTFVTSDGITPRAKGFTLGADAMNVDGSTWYYRCAR